MIILGLSAPETGNKGTYADDSYRNDVDLGCRARVLSTRDAIQACFPPLAKIPTERLDSCIGYLNQDGGWVNAAKGLSILLKRVQALNGTVLPNKNVVKLSAQEKTSKYGRHTIEIQCSDSAVLTADLVIVATGSWTASAFPDLAIGNACLATG